MIYALYGLGAIVLVGGVLYLVGRSAERREREQHTYAATGSTAGEPGCGYYDTSASSGDGCGGGGGGD